MDEQMAFSADELERLNSLALAVFSARTFSQMADVVLEGLPSLVACEKSFLTREPNPGGSRRRLMRTLTMTADELDQYERRFAALDYSAWFLEQEGAAAYRDSDLVSEEAMRRSAIFTEWVQPMGMRYVGGAVMHDRGVRAADITLFRSEEHGDFTDRELFLLTLVARQVERWLELERPAAEAAGEKPHATADLTLLTERELEVARLACTGMSVREMSDYLAISYGTARRHLANIYGKLGISSRVQLIERMG